MMQQFGVNYLAVLAAAVASMVVGFLWYGPLFGKVWIKLMNFDKKKMNEGKKKGMGKLYALTFLTSLVMSYVLAHFVGYMQAKTVADGALLGFWVWLGGLATTQLGMVMWEGKSVKLYILNTLHYLATLVVMASILAVWA